MSPSMIDEQCDLGKPCNTIYHSTTDTGNLLEELYDGYVAMAPPELLERDIEDSLLDLAYGGEGIPTTLSCDPFAFNTIDCTLALHSASSASSSDDWKSTPPFPISDSTFQNEISSASCLVSKPSSHVPHPLQRDCGSSSPDLVLGMDSTFTSGHFPTLLPYSPHPSPLPSPMLRTALPVGVMAKDRRSTLPGYVFVTTTAELSAPLATVPRATTITTARSQPEFAFEHPLVQVSSRSGSPSSLVSQCSHWQMQLQHASGGVAAAEAHGPWEGMAAQPDSSSSFIDPPPSHHPTTVQRSWSVPRMKRALNIEDADVSSYAKPTKRRRPQDTARVHNCEQCSRSFARSHNLKVHVKDVHEDERPFRCAVAGCSHSFKRSHDLTRHHQSKHTNRGSPRRKPSVRQ
ncbi:hypothetical protein BC628DRAFT_948802 [Trametes gibbosa]|uniref:C2H2-type domain-containing protein n=1 Tax=Trametes gibbosa TaxID=160864 RepID=A0A6G6FQ74_9APHY|nr:hypothetical protein BC628DRAFT_948802 [Trametes gibbosa]QIE48428.1 hypothetical protein [Trametes gibbosa]